MALIGEMQYLTIGGNTYSIPTSGGSTVSIERALTSGTKSATISVDGTSYDLYAPTPNAGTVTSVRVQATSPVQSSTSTAQSSTLNTTISLANGYGDTKNPYGTKTANYVLAGPSSGSAAVPSFRQLTAADIPDLSDTYLTSSDITDKADKFVVHIGDQISGDYYQIDKTYQQIGSAAFSGSQLVAIDMDIAYPYLGVATMGGALVIGFGFSATYNGTAIFNGYVVLKNGTAMRINSNTTIPTKVSQLTNDRGFITSYTETDPTVPSWAKASTKPTYTASEVGAIPISRTINGKALSNDITLDASDIGINPASVAPNMDGAAAVGTSSKYAREDHVHPTDTSRQANLGLTSADVTKWNNGIKIVHGSDVGYITGSSIVYNDDTIDYKINYTTDGGTTTSEITLVESNSLNYMGQLFAQSFVPKTTTVNGNALSSNITLDADDVSAIPTSAKGAASGVAPLDANSKVDSQYLPSYLIKGNTGGVFYGTCSTAAGTVAKVVECADFTADNLKAGAIIIVSFTTTNSGAVANLTMNVNGTGAKHIKYINNGALGNLTSAGYIKANVEYPFYYDGANWVVWFNYNTTYSALSEADMHTGTATTARLITAQRLKQAVQYHAPVTSVNGNNGDVTLSTSDLTNNGDGISRFVTLAELANPTFCATDATSQAVLQQAFGVTAEIVVPSNLTSTTALLYKLEPRTWFAWMNGTEMEFARMSVSVNTSNSAITLYLRGRTSIATGIMGVDSSWTVTDILPIYDGGVL